MGNNEILLYTFLKYKKLCCNFPWPERENFHMLIFLVVHVIVATGVKNLLGGRKKDCHLSCFYGGSRNLCVAQWEKYILYTYYNDLCALKNDNIFYLLNTQFHSIVPWSFYFATIYSNFNIKSSLHAVKAFCKLHKLWQVWTWQSNIVYTK